MARLRHTARKSVIPFLPSRLAERPLRRPMTGQSSHLEAAPPPTRGVGASAIGAGAAGPFFLDSAGGRVREALFSCDPAGGAPPPAPPLGVLAARVAIGGDPNDGGNDDSSSSHNTDLSEEQKPEGWVARPITRDAARGCHFHDALDTLLLQALDRRTWTIEYRCVVFQQSRGAYPDR
jgi:hypothetical protein